MNSNWNSKHTWKHALLHQWELMIIFQLIIQPLIIRRAFTIMWGIHNKWHHHPTPSLNPQYLPLCNLYNGHLSQDLMTSRRRQISLGLHSKGSSALQRSNLVYCLHPFSHFNFCLEEAKARLVVVVRLWLELVQRLLIIDYLLHNYITFYKCCNNNYSCYSIY